MNVSSSIRVARVCFLFLLAVQTTTARTYECPPSAPDAGQFETLANALQPGDELIVHAGTYSQNGRRAVTAKGTTDHPIVIRAAEGESPLFTAGPRYNCIEFIDCAHLVIRGLRFRGGSSGVRFIRGEHVTFEDCEADIGSALLRKNYIQGRAAGVSFDDRQIFNGGAATAAFVDAVKNDFWRQCKD